VSAAANGAETDSINRTVARTNGLWQQGTHEDVVVGGNAGALQKYELLSKTMNQFTSRSNAFAVYATIGYFEVMNEGPYNEQNRPILGKEMGSDEGSVTRHKFFAVVDRTNLMIDANTSGAPKQGQAPVYLKYEPAVPLPDATNGYTVFADPDLNPNAVPPYPDTPWYRNPADEPPMLVGANTPGARVAIQIPAISATNMLIAGVQRSVAVSGFYDGSTWKMVDYTPVQAPSAVTTSLAVLDVGQKAEPVLIRFPRTGPAYDPNSGTATVWLECATPGQRFKYPHARGALIRLLNPDTSKTSSTPGNPGHQAGFSYKAPQYAPVVRYAEQLK